MRRERGIGFVREGLRCRGWDLWGGISQRGRGPYDDEVSWVCEEDYVSAHTVVDE